MSKGVGYVSFAVKEDATMAIETIEKDGIELNGRKLRVQWADRKVSYCSSPSDHNGLSYETAVEGQIGG